MNTELIQGAFIELVKPTAQYYELSPHLPGYEYDALAAPGVTFDHTPIDRPPTTLKAGDIVRETGQFTVGIVVELGQGTATVNEYAEIIADVINVAAYNEGSRLTASNTEISDWWEFYFSGVDCKIRLTKPVDIRPGYKDGAHWRVPVVASYEAETII
jgi:hypothetical protein